MTRLNVYAGPAGFYLIRGGPAGDDAVLDTRFGTPAVLPGPAPKEHDKFPSNKTYFEIPIAIQDRSFNADGSLFYPDSRAFFDRYLGPFIPETEISPMESGILRQHDDGEWQHVAVSECRAASVPLTLFGKEGGFLAAPVNITASHGSKVLLGLAERADVIVDFTNVAQGNYVLGNVGPDEPFGGGVPNVDFDAADPNATSIIATVIRTIASWSARAWDNAESPPAYR